MKPRGSSVSTLRTVLLVGASILSLSPASATEFPLKTADNGRFLVDQKGEPFLVIGDTAWSLIVQLDEADIDRYLEDRQRRGFNSIIVNLIEHKFSTNPPKTLAGLAPFVTAGDFSTPNPAYFDFARKVVEKANQRGIVVWLFPAYLGYGGGDQGFFREMMASGRESLRGYGRFVAKRFRDLPNIVWVMGGDFTPKQEDQWVVAEMAEGIQAEDVTHLMTGHGSPKDSAVVAFGEQKWLRSTPFTATRKRCSGLFKQSTSVVLSALSSSSNPPTRANTIRRRIRFAAKPTGRCLAGPVVSSSATTPCGILMVRGCIPWRPPGRKPSMEPAHVT